MTGVARHGPALARRRLVLAFGSCALPFIGATASANTPMVASGPRLVRIGGSGGAMMVLRRLADAYRETGADIEVVALPPLGSEGGIGALVANRLDIAASGRPATAAEAPGVRHDDLPLGWTPLPFVVHESVPVTGLTLAEVVRIYNGEIGTWPDGSRIRIVRRPSANGDFQRLCDLSPALSAALNAAERRRGLFTAANGQENAEALETVRGAFGAMSMSQIAVEGRRVRPLELDGISPAFHGARGARYPVRKPLHLLLPTTPSLAALGLMNFARSPRGRALLLSLGYEPPSAELGAADAPRP